MELKTSQIKGIIRINIYVDLTGWESTETSIKNKILNTPFNHWVLDGYNSLDMRNNEILDMYVYAAGNSLIFNVNHIEKCE